MTADDEIYEDDDIYEIGACPSCGTTMYPNNSNTRPAWSDEYDDIVCKSCEENHPIVDYS